MISPSVRCSCCGGGVLRVALEHVGELGRGADEVQRVHADRVAGCFGRRWRRAGRLQHAQLRLQLQQRAGGSASNASRTRVGVVPAAARLRQVLDARDSDGEGVRQSGSFGLPITASMTCFEPDQLGLEFRAERGDAELREDARRASASARP